MVEVERNRERNSAGSCRSRRSEIFSHRSSFEWEEGLRDIKPRGDQAFSVLDDYLQVGHYGHHPMKNQTDSMLTSSTRVKSQTRIDQLRRELKQSSVKKSSGGASIRSLIDEEISKNTNSRKLSPSLITKLMGLDPLPATNQNSLQCSSPLNFQDRSSEEFKDVYEVLESKKSSVRKRSSSKLSQRDALNNECSEAKRNSQFFEDPFLMLLHEPSSMFVGQSLESHGSDASQIVLLKSSSDFRKSDRRTRLRCEDDDLLAHCIKEHALSLSRNKRDLNQRKATPTRIVVLKPSLDGIWDDIEESELESSSRRESRRYCSREILSESRERKKLSGNSSRLLAREITEKLSTSRSRSIESSLSKEARKRLSERWKSANRSPEIRTYRRSSGATLAEMLTSSAVKNSGDQITREEILARWGSPLGISGRLNSRSFIESFEDKLELEIASAKEESVEVKEVSCLTEDHVFNSIPVTVEDLPEDSYSTEEEGLSDKHEMIEKDCSSSVEAAEHYSPVSVLDLPDERESSLRLSRVKVDLQELLPLPDSEHPKSTSEDAEAEEIRLTFQDEDNLEFCYLLDILIDSGLYKTDRDTLLSACFSLESPVDPQVFDNLESIYKQLTWVGMSRRLMFDLVNSILKDISASLSPPGSRKVNSLCGNMLLVEEVWESLLKKSAIYESCRSNRDLEEMTWPGKAVDLEGLVMDVENMLNEDLLEELVKDVGFL